MNVYLPESADREALLAVLRAREGISGAYRSDEAAELFDLSMDRLGDLTMLSNKDTALGQYAA